MDNLYQQDDIQKKLSEKEFLSELSKLSLELQKEIEAHAIGLDSSPEAIAERRRRVLKDGDFEFFAYTYFPHHIWGEPSEFQGKFFSRFPKLLRMPGGSRDWWVAPRGEAKSSLLTKIGPCYITVQGLLEKENIREEINWQGKRPPFIDYAILLGSETKLPTKLLEVIRTELTVNAALAMDFPEACGQTKVWKVGEIVTKTGVKIEPFGADQAIRGTFHGASRPKILLGDDLITDKQAKSPTERDNRWNWLEKAIDYLGPPDGSVKFAGVGTILNKDDPISRAKRTIGHIVHHFKAIMQFPTHMDLWERCEELMRNEDVAVIQKATEKDEVIADEQLPSYKFYLKNQKKMDKGARVSWPSVRSIYSLMKQRAKNNRAFGTEMQGEPISDEDLVFTNIRFFVSRMQYWVTFGACDPSMGKGESSDPSAILVGGYDVTKLKLHVLHAEIKRRVPSKLSADLISTQREFDCQAIGFENNNAYEHMRSTFITDALAAEVSLPLIGVTASVAPEIRIDSLEPFINDIDPRILFHASQVQLLDELGTWPEKQSHHHYDGLTALHILWMIAVSRASGKPNITTRRPKKNVMAGYD